MGQKLNLKFDVSNLSRKEALKLVDDETADPRLLHQLVGLFYLTDRRMAAHTGALPETLAKLSNSKDPDTVREVLHNPTTPPDVLLQIAPQFPVEFFQIPLLDLLILEDPTFLTKLTPGVLRAFLREKDCPLSWLRWASHYGTKGDQLEILKREDFSIEILKAIANGPHPKPAERAINRLLEVGETW